jgi:hypothetical protein
LIGACLLRQALFLNESQLSQKPLLRQTIAPKLLRVCNQDFNFFLFLQSRAQGNIFANLGVKIVVFVVLKS